MDVRAHFSALDDEEFFVIEGSGWRGRRELPPRCSATQLAALRRDPGQTRRVLNHLNHQHHPKLNGPAVAGATAGATVGESQRIIGLRERFESHFHLLIHLGV